MLADCQSPPFFTCRNSYSSLQKYQKFIDIHMWKYRSMLAYIPDIYPLSLVEIPIPVCRNNRNIYKQYFWSKRRCTMLHTKWAIPNHNCTRIQNSKFINCSKTYSWDILFGKRTNCVCRNICLSCGKFANDGPFLGNI